MNELLQQIFNGLAIGSVYTLVALGLTVVFGILGIAHFAHGSLAMFGGYLTFVFSTTMGLPLFASMALAMPIGAVLGMLIVRHLEFWLLSFAELNATVRRDNLCGKQSKLAQAQ